MDIACYLVDCSAEPTRTRGAQLTCLQWSALHSKGTQTPLNEKVFPILYIALNILWLALACEREVKKSCAVEVRNMQAAHC